MSGWTLGDRPPAAMQAWLAASGAFFSSPAWAPALQALGARPRYAWHATRGVGLSLACFQRGPFGLGVAGFPVAGEAWTAACRATLAHDAGAIAGAAGLDLVRINLSMQQTHDALAVAERPEAWIPALDAWDAARSRRLRKDLAFARRACAGWRLAPPAPGACHALYAASLAARGATGRYGAAYFRSLGEIARGDGRLRLHGLHGDDGALRGFAVLAVDGDTGYYLHGGADAEGKRAGASDLLLERLVQDARAAGCRRFTLMASPWDQPGLLAFKRKWSDCEGVAPTYDVARGAAGRAGRALSRWRSRGDRAAARAFFAGRGA